MGNIIGAHSKITENSKFNFSIKKSENKSSILKDGFIKLSKEDAKRMRPKDAYEYIL